MSKPKRSLKVFLSYASQDKSTVREISQRLVGEGWVAPWIDANSLLPGQDWRTKIEEAVEDSDIVIICLSSNSVNKEGYVQKELRYAREIALEKPEDTIFLVPLRLDDCQVPRGLRFYQWGDYFGERKEETYLSLIKSLKLRREQIQEIDIHSPQKETKKEREGYLGNQEDKLRYAEELFLEGVQFFNKGQFEKAIENIDGAFQATKLSEYKIILDKYHQFREDYKNVSETIATDAGSPDLLIRALRKLDSLDLDYKNHPSLETLRLRLQIIINSSTETLIQEARRLKRNAEYAGTIDAAQDFAQNAEIKIQQIVNLGISDDPTLRLNQSVNQLISELSRLEDSLLRAEDSYSRQKVWPSNAWKISAEVRQRFPEDPKVLKLKNKLSAYTKSRIVLGLVSLMAILAFIGSIYSWGLSQTKVYALTVTPTAVFTIAPSSTPEATFTLEPVIPEVMPSPTISSLPTEIMDAEGVPMALVPNGNFTMGSADSFANEKPVLLVYLHSFYIDKYEVTNRNYNLCVQAGECIPPKKRGSKTQTSYFGNPVFDNYPVIYVTWDMAQKYCQWRDARLPSEAEWEKAARGAAGRIYPWGDTIKNTEANYNGLVGDLAVVGKYNSGVSPYGLFDMAGNAQEWVNDWYQANYYSSLFGDVENPQGPLIGDERVIRGGSWDAGKNFIRTTYRFNSSPSVSFYNISFRCAKDVTP